MKNNYTVGDDDTYYNVTLKCECAQCTGVSRCVTFLIDTIGQMGHDRPTI